VSYDHEAVPITYPKDKMVRPTHLRGINPESSLSKVLPER
jgi:hypothetical protein